MMESTFHLRTSGVVNNERKNPERIRSNCEHPGEGAEKRKAPELKGRRGGKSVERLAIRLKG